MNITVKLNNAASNITVTTKINKTKLDTVSNYKTNKLKCS